MWRRNIGDQKANPYPSLPVLPSRCPVDPPPPGQLLSNHTSCFSKLCLPFFTLPPFLSFPFILSNFHFVTTIFISSYVLLFCSLHLLPFSAFQTVHIYTSNIFLPWISVSLPNTHSQSCRSVSFYLSLPTLLAIYIPMSFPVFSSQSSAVLVFHILFHTQYFRFSQITFPVLFYLSLTYSRLVFLSFSPFPLSFWTSPLRYIFPSIFPHLSIYIFLILPNSKASLALFPVLVLPFSFLSFPFKAFPLLLHYIFALFHLSSAYSMLPTLF